MTVTRRRQSIRQSLTIASLAAVGACWPMAGVSAAPAKVSDYRARLPQDEVIYFVLPDRFENGDPSNDRGGLTGDRLVTGFDPTDEGLLPRRRPQGPDRAPRLYPGAWCDGRLGCADLQEQGGSGAAWPRKRRLSRLLDHRLHAGRPALRDQRGLQGAGRRRARARHEVLHGHRRQPHRRRHPARRVQQPARLSLSQHRRLSVPAPRRHQRRTHQHRVHRRGRRQRYQLRAAYAIRITPTPCAFPPAERNIKVPAWLNDPIYYHNRGNSTFRGELSTMGDFSSLDDVFTENPRVVRGMIDIYGAWIDKYRRRRLPDRHRAACQPGVLAAVRAGDAEARAGAGNSATSTSSAKSRRATWIRRTPP